MILVSYINARGEEIVLDDTEKSFIGELYGRKGCEAPALKYTEILYGDGSTDIVLVNADPRDVTLFFWTRTGTPNLYRQLDEVKEKLIQTGARSGSWGQLKIWQPDEEAYKVLNCVYIGGMSDAVRQYPTSMKFSLTFRANDPLFYNNYETVYTIEADDASGYLMMHDLTDPDHDDITHNPTGLYMRALADPSNDDSTHNPNAAYMKSAAYDSAEDLVHKSQKIYPTIEIFGISKNIRIYNELTGKKLEFANDVELASGDYILIETKPLQRKCVKVNDLTHTETNILSKLSADSSLDFYIERGTNRIHYRNSEASGGSGVRFTYTEGHMGL